MGTEMTFMITVRYTYEVEDLDTRIDTVYKVELNDNDVRNFDALPISIAIERVRNKIAEEDKWGKDNGMERDSRYVGWEIVEVKGFTNLRSA